MCCQAKLDDDDEAAGGDNNQPSAPSLATKLAAARAGAQRQVLACDTPLNDRPGAATARVRHVTVIQS